MKLLLTLPFLMFSIAQSQVQRSSLVNFSHLEKLTEQILFQGREVSIVHIYADYPSYGWTDAGDEGVACVDDVARAAVVYLRDYELNADTSHLATARSMLRFILAMETSDGEFFNFIRADHTINRTGRTSINSFGWWAGRALWSMSLGYRVLARRDPSFAQELKTGIERSLPNVGKLLHQYGHTEEIEGFRTPAWLLYESGADATGELMLGLIEYYRATRDSTVGQYIRKLAQGLMLMQDGDVRDFPYGAHRSWRTQWHSWGNSQTFVLANAGKILDDSSMIASAEREARGFYSRLLVGGLLKEWDFADRAKISKYEQIAYDIRPMALGLLRLYDATGNESYLKMAGLATSWLFGNNILHREVYDPASGRCYDGIRDSTHINLNSGAESTIEALYTLTEISQYPLALKYLKYVRTHETSTPEELEAEFKDDQGEQVTVRIGLRSGLLEIKDRAGER